jgi:hypothetical protein
MKEIFRAMSDYYRYTLQIIMQLLSRQDLTAVVGLHNFIVGSRAYISYTVLRAKGILKEIRGALVPLETG